MGWLLLCALFIFIVGYVLGGMKEHRALNVGEYVVSKELNRFIKGKEGIVVDNLTLPYEDSTTQIDHVFLTSKGIFVIETKHYSGWIFAEEKSTEWMQTIHKKRSYFQNPIHQNYKHLKAIEQLLDFIPTEYIHSIVVFTGDAEFKKGMPNGVLNIDSLSSYLLSFPNDVISIRDLQMSLGRLEYVRFPDTEETDIMHIENVMNQ